MNSIFLLDKDKGLVELTEAPYETEDVLQKLLEQYSAVLAGNNGGTTNLRFALVQREIPIPDSETNTGRWSMDHLLLDQEGVPTFVEVKRSC